MRVGLVVRGGVDRSGRERVIPALLWLIERLARRHTVHVFALHHGAAPDRYPLLGATVHDLGCARIWRGWRRRMQRRRLAEAIGRSGGVDVLHAYWAMPAGLIATQVAKTLRIPSVVTADSGEWVSLPGIRYGLQRRWIDRAAVARTMRRASRVTVCSHAMAGLAEKHGVRAEVIPLGVPVPVHAAVERAGGPPWRLLHVSSLNLVKDHATLIGALSHVVAKQPQVHLDIVGEDTLGGAVQRLVAERGLSAHVTFHGFQPVDRLIHFYERAHVHVVSSRHEAAGVVVLEAAAAGVPTVGSRVGYVSDWGADGRAVAVPPRDPEALGAAVLELLENADDRGRIAEAAHRWTVAHDADWTADRFDRLYRELVPQG